MLIKPIIDSMLKISKLWKKHTISNNNTFQQIDKIIYTVHVLFFVAFVQKILLHHIR